MPTCPTCTTEVPDSLNVCPRCSTPLPWGADVTRLATAGAAPGAADLTSSSGAAATPPSGTRARASRRTDSTGSWLTSTEAIDHGRFAPGSLLDGRYRIVGRLGRGGMGEVYRADDLKLGQPVALKFLPESVDRDPARLTQLHTEVRMARQVSHPNVCRVYDVAEFEGHTFLSMEYVDGEDLGSLLRRIGRFPQDRAIELARQVCAGLAAAHDRGVVHRDLKPANIMLDGGGKIRITDFGLAGATGETLRAGTPAYMAPEQLAGQEITARSDVYSLGLVLYELFTGKRAIEGDNLAELIARREQGGIVPPTEIVRDLDPAIGRAIMRCLEADASRRPPSALAVAAALPGGDPLAAALAAGETPSPEMVAAAGETSALRPLTAIAALALALGAIVFSAVLLDRLLIVNKVPVPKPPMLLAERAKEILASLGYPADGRDSAQGLVPAEFIQYLREHPDAGTPERLASGTPATLKFWRRTSPETMLPSKDQDTVSITNPPLLVPGMTLMKLDPEGRLIEFAAIPPEVDPPGAHGSVEWKPLFSAAGLDLAKFTPAAPGWTPRGYADTRAAWTGPLPGFTGQQLRVEAAAYQGKPVEFQLISPWTRPARTTESDDDSGGSVLSALVTITIFLMFTASALIARHNLRKGRGDRRGALQLTFFVSVLPVITWLIAGKHVANPQTEMDRFFTGQPLWAAGLLCLLYLAVEPYIRRFWPTTVVSWSRLMARQWRDPLVGRDILLGIGVGAIVNAVGLAENVIRTRLGYHVPPQVSNIGMLLGTNIVFAHMLVQVFNTILNAVFAVFGMVLLKIIVRRETAAVVLAVALMGILVAANRIQPMLLTVSLGVIVVALIVLTIQRLGLLAIMSAFFVMYMLSDAIVTFDTSRWYFADGLILVSVPAALACYGFYASRAGEPLFGRRLLD